MSRIERSGRPLFRPAKPFPSAPAQDSGIGHLVLDLRGGDIIQRRRAECSGLGACERAWVAEHGSAQAMCQVGCTAFDQAPERPVDTSGCGGVAGPATWARN